MRRTIVVAVALALVAGGCDGGGASDQTATSVVESTETTASDSTTTIMEPTSTTSTTTTVADPGESTLYIDFYWVGTYGISVPTVAGEIRRGEILVADGFDVPPVFRITANDIEAITDVGPTGIDLTMSEETILKLATLELDTLIEAHSPLVFRVTIGEATAWGWLWGLGLVTVPETAYIGAAFSRTANGQRNVLPLLSRSTTIGGVPLSEAIKEAWLRSQE